MPTIRILAIEDDPIYAEGLRLVIDELKYVLIDVISSPDEFIRLVKATLPDLFLIDIDLGVAIDGIELARQISTISGSPIIFLTAYKDKETILRATGAKPSAYITKPYDASALQAAIEIAVSGRNNPATFEPVVRQESMFVKSDGKIKKVTLNDIQYIEVKEKYCHIHLMNEQLIVNKRLKDLLDLFPADLIFQVHRSFAVMKQNIKDIDSDFNKLRIANVEIPIGNSYRQQLVDFVNLR